jgi:hypothetical protein
MDIIARRTGVMIKHHRTRAKEGGSALDYGLGELRALVAAALERPCIYCQKALNARSFGVELQECGEMTHEEVARSVKERFGLDLKPGIVAVLRATIRWKEAEAQRRAGRATSTESAEVKAA